MSSYFSDETYKSLIELIYISGKMNNFTSKYKESALIYTYFSRLNFDKIVYEGSIINLGQIMISTTTNYGTDPNETYSDLAEEFNEKMIRLFGVKSAKLHLRFDSVTEKEPDVIPPLYWGELETQYHYKINIILEL